MTIPTISQIPGNTLLELFNNGYNTLKNSVYSKDETDEIVDAVANEIPDMSLYYTKSETYSKTESNTLLGEKQNTLIAGDNIVIEGNTISAIQGGSLDNYYTKSETDSLLNDKADSSSVYTTSEVDTLLNSYYTKTETDTLLEGNGYKIINTITPSVETEYGYKYVKIDNLNNGDIVDISYTVHMRTSGSTDFDLKTIHTMFVFKNSVTKYVANEGGFSNLYDSGGTYTGDIVGNTIWVESSVVDTYCKLRIEGTRTTLSNGAFVNANTYCNDITITDYTILRRA